MTARPAILVTGGAGYIGSHTVAALLADGRFAVTILDDLSTGHTAFAPDGVELLRVDLRGRPELLAALAGREFAAVIHFAAKSLVGESMRDPALYYDNNLVGTKNLLDALRAGSTRRIIFSSSAAVYGEPAVDPIPESAPVDPTNPYGETKRAMECLLAWYGRAYGFRSVALRYFNAAGAADSGRLGEVHDPETHLVPLVLLFALGRRPELAVFGNDYPTPDGTCVRDYIHVDDLARAHRLALDHLLDGGESAVFNVGYGHGYSVFEVIAAAVRVIGRPLEVRIAPRRPGDPARLVADATAIRNRLGFTPRRDDLEEILRSAWRFTKGWFGS